MKRFDLRLAAVAGCALVSVLVSGHSALAAEAQLTLVPAAAAWYQTNGTCVTPAGCVTTDSLPASAPVDEPAPHPYPARSLHVSTASGQETARTYLQFPMEQVADRMVTSGSLIVPLDVNASSGSVSPETSRVLVCGYSGVKIGESEGTLATPPTASCADAVTMTYSAEPEPHLRADLGSLRDDLPDLAGLVLMTNAEAASAGETWHVVFSGPAREDTSATAPPTLSLLLVEPSTAPAPGSNVVAPPAEEGPGTSMSWPLSSGEDLTSALPEVSLPAPVLPAEQLSMVSVAGPAAVVLRRMPPIALWYLPLALLLLAPYTYRALTKDPLEK